MSAKPSKFLAKYSAWKCKFSFFVLALVFCASSAWAAVPPVIVDGQQTLGSGYGNPQSIASNNTNQGAVFIADTNNNQIIALVNGFNYVVGTGSFVLSTPQALALDVNGDLYVGDTPTNNGSSFGRVIELLADGTGNLSGTAALIFSGAPLTNPISLAVDSTGTVFIGDYPVSGNGAIYSLAPGGTAPQPLNITGLPAQFTPAALLRDSTTNLYIADNGNFVGSNGAVYIAPAAGGAAQPVPTQSFVINEPSGLALDAAGDLYILSQLGTGTGVNAGQQVVVIPGASPSTPYILPNTGIGLSSGVVVDPKGNVDILDLVNGAVVQLAFAQPINMGNVSVGQSGTPVLFNFEFNAPTRLGGFRVVTQGDVSSELVQSSGGSCVNGQHNNVPGGGPPISPYSPYTCNEFYVGAPSYPGIRSSAILVRGAGTTILASMPVYQTGFAGAEITYPLNSTTTAMNLQQPQAVAISGLNKEVYVADTLAAAVYSTGGLAGSTLTPVSTGTIVLQAPSALALDGAGNLFIADFNLGEVIEVPTTTGQAPSVVNTGGLLQHPIALAFDYLGNLYIGDAGSGGQDASSSNPGYVVKLPVGGAAFQMTIPFGIQIVFPQALATDPYTATLLIGDGGDLSGVGQVVQVSADGTFAGTGPINGVTDPTGLAFDAAENIYVLDGAVNTITVIAQSGLPPYLLSFDNSSLTAASALAISAGGQSFVIANLGQGSSNGLLYLNGDRSALAFGGVNVGTPSPSMTATEYNIGNQILTLHTPFYTTNGTNPAFSILGSSTCGNGVVLFPAISCSINAQFTPQATGATSQQIMVDSDGYNNGVPILTLRGTGK